MAALRYRDEHNKVGYLQKPKGSDDYHQILDFLGASHIRSPELGPPAILATIDATPYTITEDSVRGQLQLADDGGIDDLPIADIYSRMDNLGYVTEGKLTFYKNKFSPQWRFLVHTILHCLSTKSGSWDQFGSPIAVALICLSDRRKFNCKLFANMRLNFEGKPMPLLAADAYLVDLTNLKTFVCTPKKQIMAPIAPVFELWALSMPLPQGSSSFPAGHTSGGAEDPITLTALSSVVSSLVQKQVKAMEVKLKTKKRKLVVSDSDKEDRGEQDVDLDALHALANAAVTVDSTKSPGGASSNPAACSYDPTNDVPTDVPSGVAPTGPSTVSSWVVQYQRKRQREVLASAANYSDAAWDIILARLQANPDLSSTIFGVDFPDDDFAAKMVALVNSWRKELAEQRAQERRDRPMTPAQLRQYMRTYVKNQGPAVYTTGWTMAQVQKLSPEQLQEEFDKIQRAVAFTRGLKRDGSPMTNASSKKLKTGDVEVDVEAPSHGVPQEVEVEAPSQDVSREKVDAPSHSQNIPEAQVEVPSQEATVEDVEVPSNIASKAQQTASSLKKVGTKKKLLGRKGVHTSQSTIPIEEGDPDAEHKLCIKYASDEDSASDCDTPVHLYAVVDWELLPTGLGSINAIYRLPPQTLSQVLYGALWEILNIDFDRFTEMYWLPEVNDGSDFWKNQHTWSIQNWKLYSFSGVHVLETVSGLVIHMFVDKKYPLTINLIERMLDHQLEICHGTVGNELTTAVQLIAFLKKQISDSKRPKVHENTDMCRSFMCSSQDSSRLDVAVKFIFLSSRYVVPTGRVVVPTGRYVVPAGKVVKIYLEWDPTIPDLQKAVVGFCEPCVLGKQKRFLALGWHLKEIHVTWAYLEKKRTRPRLYTKYLEEPRIHSVETASPV
ncbi:hypothetical protein Tco_0085864 [Tanacetum coccineum]